MQTLRNLLLTTAFILLIAAAASYMTALWIGEERLMLLVAAFGVPAFVVVLITLPLGVASAHREIEEAWVEIAAHCGGVTENARADTIIRASIDRHFPERLYGSCVRVVSGCSGGMDFRVLEWDDGERTRLLVFITNIGSPTVRMRVSPFSRMSVFLPTCVPAGWSRFTEPDGNVRHRFLVECPTTEEFRVRDLVRRCFLPRNDELRAWTYDFDGAALLVEAAPHTGRRFIWMTPKNMVQTLAIESLTTALSVAVTLRDAP